MKRNHGDLEVGSAKAKPSPDHSHSWFPIGFTSGPRIGLGCGPIRAHSGPIRAHSGPFGSHSGPFGSHSSPFGSHSGPIRGPFRDAAIPFFDKIPRAAKVARSTRTGSPPDRHIPIWRSGVPARSSPDHLRLASLPSCPTLSPLHPFQKPPSESRAWRGSRSDLDLETEVRHFSSKGKFGTLCK